MYELLSPDDLSAIMNSPFVSTYWPMLVGAVVILIFLLRGYTRTTIPIFLFSVFIQVWQMGLFDSE